MTAEEKKAKRRAYYKAHRKEITAKQREWRKKDYAANPEKYLAQMRKWQAEHPDYVKAYHKAYAFTHARKARAASAKWREENYEYKKLYGRLRGRYYAAVKKGDAERAATLAAEMKQMIATRRAIMKDKAAAKELV